MKSGKCPKCGSEDVFSHEGTTHRSVLEWRWRTITSTSDYACGSCGYVESYLRDDDDKAKVRKNWQKVGGN